jgi:hypothetical protein
MHGAASNHGIHAKAPILRAIKISPGRSGLSFNGTANFDDVTYYVVKTAALGERRLSRRRRTRLRSGKIVDPRSAHLIDCQIYDWSGMGARLRLFDSVSVPGRIQLFEDVSERLINATIVWRRSREIGIRFVPYARKCTLTKAQLACFMLRVQPHQNVACG